MKDQDFDRPTPNPTPDELQARLAPPARPIVERVKNRIKVARLMGGTLLRDAVY